MGTYFQGNSEIQGDGSQTLILMNSGYNHNLGGYSDTTNHQPPPLSNFFFLNSANSNATTNLTHAPNTDQSTQHFVGIPLSASQQDHPHRPSIVHSHQHGISTLHSFVPPMHHYGLYNQLDLTAAREATPSNQQQQQGLSLSLSSQYPSFGPFRTEDSELPSPAPAISPKSTNDVQVAQASSSVVSLNGVQSVLLNSKYLKVAQELLYEVANVGKGLQNIDQLGKPSRGNTASIKGGSAGGDGLSGEGQTSSKRSVELTTVERQEVQMKKSKLVNMLDEVEHRYRQYHTQMQLVISWFEQSTGIGSAKPYTALALQTISKQFRCLKDAIMGQIQAASKSLGEEESLGGKAEGSRLKFVDNQLRQQKALQQLGMIQHNAWRPQRGLPERSVSVLRAWLFEHFLHPYPKDSDKHMLAKQTGLTRSQVSNWFINARVRLWKPMVEEMYMEETKEQQHNGSEGETRKNEAGEKLASKARAPSTNSMENYDTTTSQNTRPLISVSTASTSPNGLSIRNNSGFSLTGSSEMEEMTRGSPKKQRGTGTLHSLGNVSLRNMEFKPEANNEQMAMKFHNDQRQSRDGFTLMGSPTNYIQGFGSYSIGDIGRFGTEQFSAPYSANGVSLTLGLPHGENLSMSGTNQGFLPEQNIQIGRRLEEGEFGAVDTPTSSHSANIYDNMDIQSRKRLAAQLLPDFVA
ncbi:BEL1-like homeodomain protein 1 [Heracleum sosnowskyi]|uniref:BEL1-like homeodomain protein 1 n=1 Tax=Heracleum sosnowskyi TaxID=360622 RepID=A0AAD8ND73_9APIA|nr:BEL1-like homeodomain protein 1 [Heracleum sosnowskyi]